MNRPDVVFDFNTIELAFEYASLNEHSNEAYLDRHTGNSLYFSGSGDSDDAPDDLDDTARYVAVPDIRDLGMGSKLAIRFASETAPRLLDEVRDAFRSRGGFRRFNDLLDRNNLRESWYEYEADNQRKAIVQWCVDNGIRFTVDNPIGG